MAPSHKDTIGNKNVLVTGGAGYIGSHTCKALAQAGYQPITYDNLSMGHEWAVKWGPLEIGDILDQQKLSSVIEKYHPSAILHFAALAYVGESVNQPARYWNNNVAGSFSLIQAAIANGIDKFIFSSTCAIYGEPNQTPIIESFLKQPVNPYGTTKLVVEAMLKDFAAEKQITSSLNSVSLRYFNAAGADPDSEIGEDHDPETHLIPLVLKSAMDATHPLTVFGGDYPTKDGSCIRDYIHVCDLAQAHVKALQYLDNQQGAFGFNLGNDKGYSVLDIIQAAEKITGKSINYTIGKRREGDPPELVSDSALAAQALNWTALCSDIDNIIESAWKWMHKQ